MTDATAHSKEQRLNARLEYIDKKIDIIGTIVSRLTNMSPDGPTALSMQDTLDSAARQYGDNLADIATAATLLRELEKDE